MTSRGIPTGCIFLRHNEGRIIFYISLLLSQVDLIITHWFNTIGNCLDNSSIRSFSPISICSHMKDVDIIAGCPFFPLDGRQLLDEEATELTIGWVMASYIGYETMPLGRVQGAADVVTGGPPTFWLVYFGGRGLGMTNIPDLKIIC